jgi:hypothetical protein
MKILDFFLFLWVIFALLDPDRDPATQIIADPCGSGSETLLADPHQFEDLDPAFHCNADPDPAVHCNADPDPSFQLTAKNLEKVFKWAHIPYILACHLQIDADPYPVNHFDADLA